MGILLFVDRPMEWELDRGTVSDFDFASRFRSWVCIFKVHGFKRIGFKIDLFAINCNNIEIKHCSIAVDFIIFGCLIVASQN